MNKQFLFLIITAMIIIADLSTQPTKAHTSTQAKTLIGVFAPDGINEFEKVIGQPANIQAVFASQAEFPSWVSDELKGTSKIMLIFFEPSDPRSSQFLSFKKFIGDENKPGILDEEIRMFATKAEEVQKSGTPIIIIPFPEPNLGDEVPWSPTRGGNTPELFKEAWVHLRSFFSKNIFFGFAYNCVSIPKNLSLKSLYPGDQYVDFLGVDGFDFGEGRKFTEIFGPAFKEIDELKPNHRPWVFSFGSPRGKNRSKWFEETFAFLEKIKPGGIVYFNQDKERKWKLDTNEQTFRSGVKTINK